jgi:hypothetical protein
MITIVDLPIKVMFKYEFRYERVDALQNYRTLTYRKASAGIKAIKLAAKPSYVSTRSRDSDKSEYTATPHNLKP